MLAIVLCVLSWSAINPKTYFIWFLEVLPVLIAIPLLFIFYHKFKFSNIVYFLIFLHAIVLIIGGHFTYEDVPLFNWLKDSFNLSRNYYDKVGHFMQGFVPAMIIREILLRKTSIKRDWIFTFLITFSCLGISALYEIFEWLVAIISGASADAFLGMQGDMWDTQTDMACALIGAIVAQTVFAKWHDRQIKNM